MKLNILISAVFVIGLSAAFGQSLEVPNVFTPNNDGVNDVFEISSTGYDNVICSIYNRHGGLVYEFFGLEGNWDGHSHAGVPCVEGVYFTIIEAVKPDGSSDTFQGSVQLVRN